MKSRRRIGKVRLNVVEVQIRRPDGRVQAAQLTPATGELILITGERTTLDGYLDGVPVRSLPARPMPRARDPASTS